MFKMRPQVFDDGAFGSAHEHDSSQEEKEKAQQKAVSEGETESRPPERRRKEKSRTAKWTKDSPPSICQRRYRDVARSDASIPKGTHPPEKIPRGANRSPDSRASGNGHYVTYMPCTWSFKAGSGAWLVGEHFLLQQPSNGPKICQVAQLDTAETTGSAVERQASSSTMRYDRNVYANCAVKRNP